MHLRDYLLAIGTSYDRSAGLGAPSQALLRNAPIEIGPLLPGGLTVEGSGGKGRPTFTPWIGIFDPDETDTPQKGIYVVYLFAQDRRSVTLTLMQGITWLSRVLGAKPAREKLAQEAATIRSALGADELDGLDSGLDLGAGGFRQRAYEAGTIAALRYELEALPTEVGLMTDLRRFTRLYQLAIAAKRRLLQSEPGLIVSPASVQDPNPSHDPLVDFKPKNDADYVSTLSARQLLKTRRHETLVGEYGRWAAERGFQPSTREHPKDLVLRKGAGEWLVEVKVLYRGNATDAVRAALGQLLAYRYFLYPENATPSLVALFSEEIGEGYVRFLGDCGIASVWKVQGGWNGSMTAIANGLIG